MCGKQPKSIKILQITCYMWTRPRLTPNYLMDLRSVFELTNLTLAVSQLFWNEDVVKAIVKYLKNPLDSWFSSCLRCFMYLFWNLEKFKCIFFFVFHLFNEIFSLKPFLFKDVVDVILAAKPLCLCIEHKTQTYFSFWIIKGHGLTILSLLLMDISLFPSGA